MKTPNSNYYPILNPQNAQRLLANSSDNFFRKENISKKTCVPTVQLLELAVAYIRLPRRGCISVTSSKERGLAEHLRMSEDVTNDHSKRNKTEKCEYKRDRAQTTGGLVIEHGLNEHDGLSYANEKWDRDQYQVREAVVINKQQCEQPPKPRRKRISSHDGPRNI